MEMSGSSKWDGDKDKAAAEGSGGWGGLGSVSCRLSGAPKALYSNLSQPLCASPAGAPTRWRMISEDAGGKQPHPEHPHAPDLGLTPVESTKTFPFSYLILLRIKVLELDSLVAEFFD